MNFPLLIATRYFFSKKTKNAINIISTISVIGVMVGTMGLIIVLSVFNGFERLVLSLYNTFDPQLVIMPSEGKTFITDQKVTGILKKNKAVAYVVEVLEENALVKYNDK